MQLFSINLWLFGPLTSGWVLKSSSWGISCKSWSNFLPNTFVLLVWYVPEIFVLSFCSFLVTYLLCLPEMSSVLPEYWEREEEITYCVLFLGTFFMRVVFTLTVSSSPHLKCRSNNIANMYFSLRVFFQIWSHICCSASILAASVCFIFLWNFSC